MAMEVPEWKVLIILMGVAFLLLGRLASLINVKLEVVSPTLGCNPSWQYNLICPNGAENCVPAYRQYTVVRNDHEQETLASKETKTPKKLTKRRKSHSLKAAKRDKQFGVKSKRITHNEISIASEDFIAWHLHADIQLYMSNSERQKDPNISQANFDTSSSKQDIEGELPQSASLQSSDMNSIGKVSLKDIPKEQSGRIQKMGSSHNEPRSESGQLTSSSTDPGHIDDIVSHFTEKLFWLMLGMLIGIAVRHYWKCHIRYLIYDAITCLKDHRRYKQRDSIEHPQFEVDANLNLSLLPPDLEDLLAINLDVRCKAGRSYGWRKVGAEFNVSQDYLRYLAIEYKRDNGSPTIKLLQILGMNKNKTTTDLVEVLKKPRVNRLDIVSRIKLT